MRRPRQCPVSVAGDFNRRWVMKTTMTAQSRKRRTQLAESAHVSHKISSVLVPLDFSHVSLKGLEYALALAKQFGARLHLVHVCDYDFALPSLEGVSFVIPHAEIRRRTKRRLRDLAAKYGPEMESDNLHVVSGRAYHEVCRLAQKLNVDLIVTTTRGHTGLKHVLLGSTAERLVQHAQCPVLIVRDRERDCVYTNEKGDRALRLKKILVPVDFSDCSMAGIEFAVPFAHFWKTQLLLFNSVPITSVVPYGEFGARDPRMNLDLRAMAETSLRDVASKILERGVAVEAFVEVGPAARQICEYADRNDVDLIVTSTHGSTGFVHALIGSTAEHVVRYAHCPVLVVPSRKRKGRS